MIYWTIQRREIVEEIVNGKDYYPDFTMSNFVEENAALLPLYQHVLDSFNRVNETDYEGLIFTFMYGDDDGIFPIPTIREFVQLMQERYQCIQSLWERFRAGRYVILQLELEQDFNPIFIDINDFQFLMPPVFPLPPYSFEDEARLKEEMADGIITPSDLPSNIIQAHIPCIKKEYITNIYEMFDARN